MSSIFISKECMEEKKEKKEFRFPIRIKTILLIVVFGLVLAEIAMVYFSLVSSNRNKENYKSDATDLSYTIALTINKDDVKTLTNNVVEIYNNSTKPGREKEGTPEYEEYMASFDAIKQSEVYLRTQKFLKEIKAINSDTESAYLGYVDPVNKSCVYIVYDRETDIYPTGIIDPLYEEDYPMIDNPKLGFVASIYESELEGMLVTAGAPILDENDNVICYALVDITMATVRSKQTDAIIRLFLYLIATVVVISIIGIIIVHFTLVKPVKTLQNAAKNYDASNPEATHEIFTNLKVNVHDELVDLANSMKKMENDVYNKINELTKMNNELVASQQETEKMKEIANTDALTGVYSKSYYNYEVEILDQEIKDGTVKPFGIIMIDLNNLKLINDDFGHGAGDNSLIGLSKIICDTFKNSPIYRIGGDEFVAILKGKDYVNADKLIEKFNNQIADAKEVSEDQISAAIGYSAFDKEKDKCVEDVFRRADKAMYSRKRQMKQ